jgi:LacI family transcriptional regulator
VAIEPRRPATIAEVAERAGVSISTASKAMNGRGRVGAATRDRVRAVADEVGFVPNALAKSLLTGRSLTVGLVTSYALGRFTMPVILGVEEAQQRAGIAVILCDGRDDPIREEYYIRSLISRRVDGIVVIGGSADPRPPIATGLAVPIVYAMTPSRDSEDCSLVADDEGGARLAVDHLLGAGRTRIGHITGPELYRPVQIRSKVTQSMIEAAGLQLAGERVLYGDWSEAWGRQAIHMLLRAEPNVDAVFCGNDQIGRGVVDSLNYNGYRVPDDIAVVGFDNWEDIALAALTPLTTIDMNLQLMGKIVAERILDAMGGYPSKGLSAVPCRLVVRASTGEKSQQRVSGRRSSWPGEHREKNN